MEASSNNGSQSTVREILVCGGLSQNRMFLQCQANVVSLPVWTSTENDPVLIGAAMLAASAAQYHSMALRDTVITMTSKACTVYPSTQLKL